MVKADTNSETYKFFMMTQDLYLVHHVTEETRKRKGTDASVGLLDYVFTDEEKIVENLKYEVPLGKSDHVCLGKSDHVCLTWNYVVKVKEKLSTQHMLDYWKGNYNQINEEMEEIN